MPNASAGARIFDPAQLGENVITQPKMADNSVGADEILADAVAASEIAAGAVGTSEVADGTIVDADISASAGIVDTKLATISTAGKVSGAALTSLGSTPAGAGVMPSANLPASAPSLAIATVGEVVLAESNAAKLSGLTAVFVLLKSIRVIGAGTYRTKFTLRATGTTANLVYGRIYKNGVALGIERQLASFTLTEYVEDLVFTIGDLVQLYGHNDGRVITTTNSEVSLFKIAGVHTTIVANTVVTD